MVVSLVIGGGTFSYGDDIFVKLAIFFEKLVPKDSKNWYIILHVIDRWNITNDGVEVFPTLQVRSDKASSSSMYIIYLHNVLHNEQAGHEVRNTSEE